MNVIANDAPDDRVRNPIARVVTICLILSYSIGVVSAQPTEYVKCTATLKEYVPDYRWSEEIDDVIFHIRSPLATFSIVSPERFSGRRIRVLFAGNGFEQIFPGPNEKVRGIYEFEVPGDYFDGPDGQVIRENSVLALTRISDRE